MVKLNFKNKGDEVKILSLVLVFIFMLIGRTIYMVNELLNSNEILESISAGIVGIIMTTFFLWLFHGLAKEYKVI